MDKSNLKNIVILNNLPSNLVDEAIIVLKENKNIKNLQKIEQNNNELEENSKQKNKDYIVKEAEMLINRYALKYENKEKSRRIIEKYKKIKIYSTLITILATIETLIILF